MEENKTKYGILAEIVGTMLKFLYIESGLLCILKTEFTFAVLLYS